MLVRAVAISVETVGISELLLLLLSSPFVAMSMTGLAGFGHISDILFAYLLSTISSGHRPSNFLKK